MADVRAPVSILALMASMPKSGKATHSRQPITGMFEISRFRLFLNFWTLADFGSGMNDVSTFKLEAQLPIGSPSEKQSSNQSLLALKWELMN